MAVNKSLRNMAKTFFLVAAILGSIAIIPALWLWPMYSIYKNEVLIDNEEHVALAVCSIIFSGVFGIVAGILLIVSNGQTNSKG